MTPSGTSPSCLRSKRNSRILPICAELKERYPDYSIHIVKDLNFTDR